MSQSTHQKLSSATALRYPASRHTDGLRSPLLLTKSATVVASLLFAFFLLVVTPVDIRSQSRVRETYPARQNVRLELKNRNGTITVEGWGENKIEVVAVRESPVANIAPRVTDDALIINVSRDNEGRRVGDVNFIIRVPFDATVDLETMMGGITVRNLRGASVRAHVTEGDIELTNIHSSFVLADNVAGNILFDGVFAPRGTYKFECTRGDIAIRVPENSSFNFTGMAKQIEMGPFAGKGQFDMSDKRRIFGKVRDGNATFGVRNILGTVTLMGR